jgi:hypothetical protein
MTSARVVTGIALDRDGAAGGARAGIGAGGARHRERAGRHAFAEALADIALDPDRALRERRTHPVEPGRAALDHEAVGAVEADLEDVAEGQAAAARADGELARLGLGQTAQGEGGDVEKVDPLRQITAQSQRAHAAGFSNRSRRW